MSAQMDSLQEVPVLISKVKDDETLDELAEKAAKHILKKRTCDRAFVLDFTDAQYEEVCNLLHAPQYVTPRFCRAAPRHA